jgi:hypothetical protein
MTRVDRARRGAMNAKEPPEDIEALRTRIETLERRASDLALKSQIVSSQLFGKTGLDRFFGEPEFWENPYDSGQADCSRRCIEELATSRQACDGVGDPTKRQACYAEALSRAATCHTRCAQRFPPPIG